MFTIVLLVLEFIQIKVIGTKPYLEQGFNLNDWCLIISQFVFGVWRLLEPDDCNYNLFPGL